MMFGIDCYLKLHKYCHDVVRVSVLHDAVFEDCCNALKNKRTYLKSLGMGNRPKGSVELEPFEEVIMWDMGVLGAKSSFSLHFTCWLYILVIMGLKGCDEHRKISFGD
jgi:hypothetical protein